MSTNLIQYTDERYPNPDYPHGQLRPVVGAHHYQVLRANRELPHEAAGWGWTYNHAPMLAYWQDRFWLEYLSNPACEHIPPGHTLLTSSADGRHWERPGEIFPVYSLPEDCDYAFPDGTRLPTGYFATMHQRMGFYVSAGGRLLALGFYGICGSAKDLPNDGSGIGRVVREIRGPGEFGPIHFIRYNRHAGWNEENTAFPFYTMAADQGFVEACTELLENKLMTLQWWEEDRSDDGFYAVQGDGLGYENLKAFCWYTLPDGATMGIWKFAKAALSTDNGATWSPPAEQDTIVANGSKIWGQRLGDGQYVLVNTPVTDGHRRWPLALIQSEDGRRFHDMLLVNGKVSPLRYQGQYKDPGLNYVRGIAEGNGSPADDAVWITYSAGKEDIWVTRIPVPLRATVDDAVDDDFSAMEAGGVVPDWNIHCGRWTPIEVAAGPGEGEQSLCIADRDPCEVAQAERVFPRSQRLWVQIRLRYETPGHGRLAIELCDERSVVPVSLQLKANCILISNSGSVELAPGQWHDLEWHIDLPAKRHRLKLNGCGTNIKGRISGPARTVERIRFRTGAEYRLPPDSGPSLEVSPTTGAHPLPEARWYLARLRACPR